MKDLGNGGQVSLALSGKNGQIAQIAPIEAAWPKIIAALFVTLECTYMYGPPRI